MAKQDLRINTHGVNVKDLEAGFWVVVKWDDIGDELSLLLEVEQRPATFKGARSLKVLDLTNDGDWQINTRADSTQVVRIIGDVALWSFEAALSACGHSMPTKDDI